MTSFDRSLNTIWKNCVQKVSADNQIDPPTAHDLTITWDTLRSKMIDSLINTGYDRYKRWYNKLKKRTLDQTIAAAEMDNGPTASGSGRLVRSRRLR
jgi:hypothetical protein